MHVCSRSGQVVILRHLIKCGAEVNLKDAEGNTPLHYGSMCGFPLIVTALLDAGADNTVANNEGKTPSDCAITDEVRQALN